MLIDGDEVNGFEEKPPRGDGYISGGFMVIKREFLDKYVTDDEKMFLERVPLHQAAADGNMGVYRHEGFW
jgi:glucose-1-phosphate cytidylyltransferase